MVSGGSLYLLLYATIEGKKRQLPICTRTTLTFTCIVFFGRESSWWWHHCAGPDNCLAYKHTGYAFSPYTVTFLCMLTIFAIVLYNGLFTLLYFAFTWALGFLWCTGVRAFCETIKKKMGLWGGKYAWLLLPCRRAFFFAVRRWWWFTAWEKWNLLQRWVAGLVIVSFNLWKFDLG